MEINTKYKNSSIYIKIWNKNTPSAEEDSEEPV